MTEWIINYSIIIMGVVVGMLLAKFLDKVEHKWKRALMQKLETF